ncbi:MAG: hemolysin family protein [Gemmatimonadales bacterium]
MTWVLLVAGLAIAFAGSASAVALVTTARVAVADAIARRLRGTRESLAWLTTTERQVVAATAAASFGVGLVGATIPGFLSRATLLELAVFIVVIGVPATLLGGYLLPRWLTTPRAERVVELMSPLLSGWTAALSVVLPARGADPTHDIQSLAREGSASGVGGEELVMVGGVMTFSGRQVREVMTPRTDLVAIPRDATDAEIEAVFTESGYSRLPVYGRSLDEIVGVMHAFDLFKHQAGQAVPLRPVSFAPALRGAGDLLVDMQRERQHFAVVVDEFGGTAGIVTLEDLLEALVGEIAEEDAGTPAPALPAGSLLELDGSVSPLAVAEHFEVELPATNATSFAGLLAQLAGRIPVAGERFTLRGLEVDVLQASPVRVERLVIRRIVSAITNLDRASA